jgi:hypothetical protein
MVYYNTYLLSELLHQKQNQLEAVGHRGTTTKGENDILHLQEAIATIKQVSPIAWRHIIHIYGTYQFLRRDALIDWKEVIMNVKL